MYGCLVGVTGNLTIANGCNLYPYSEPTNGGSIAFVVSNALVSLGGAINADAKGFQGRNGNTSLPGYGYGGGQSSGSRGGGGGYGGAGSKANDNTAGGVTYGLANAPTWPGSGAGGGNAVGGSGGSLVWINAGNAIVIYGTISANGGNAGDQNGGGSGGGVCLIAPTFTGTGGVVRANGGTAGSNSGGGGGGRVAFTGWMTNQFDGTIAAAGGVSSQNGPASNGTILLLWNTGSSPISMTVRGNPLRHTVAAPYDYGTYAMSAGTAVTDAIPLTAEQTASARYICYGWTLTNDAGTALDGDGTTQAVFTVNTNVALVWNWTNQWFLTTTAGSTNGGLEQDMTGWYTNGVQVTVTATANVNYAFLSWSGLGVPVNHNGDNPITLTMDQARQIQANFVSTLPTPRAWNGTNTWLTDTNWTPTGVPGSNDSITIQSGTCVFTDPAIVQALTVNSGATLLFTNWNTTLSAPTVIVLSNGVITHAVCNTNVAGGTSNRVTIITSDLTVDLGGSIDASGKGFVGGGNGTIPAPGQGPGGGGGAAASISGGGAGYGGAGSTSRHGSVGGAAYGSPYTPGLPGSGGGGGSSGGPGGAAGGGVLVVNASGRVVVNGAIRANGATVSGGKNGGGSGGSIYVTCSSLAGSGDIQAYGGNGSDGESGAGGGGRIAIYYTAAQSNEVPQPTIRFSATMGTVGWSPGSPGTFYVPSSVFFPDRLSDVLKNSVQVYGVNSWTPVSPVISNSSIRFREGAYQFQAATDLVVYGGAGLLGFTNATVSVGGSIYVTNGASLTMVRGTNSAETLAIGSNIWLDSGTMSYEYPLANPAGPTIGGNIVLTNGGSLALRGGVTNGISPLYGGLLDFSSKDLYIPTNCTLYLYAHTTNGGPMRVKVNNLTILPGGQVNGDGGGFAGVPADFGYGPGSGHGYNNSAGGGGYGGPGGTGNHGVNSYGGPTYGSSNAPIAAGQRWRRTRCLRLRWRRRRLACVDRGQPAHP